MNQTFVSFDFSLLSGYQDKLSIETFEITKENEEFFVDPYNLLWKKILGTVFYILQLFGALIVLSFIRYETQGHAAHFRTALNQITSWIGLVVSIKTWIFFYLTLGVIGEICPFRQKIIFRFLQF